MKIHDILVPTDFSQASDEALDFAVEMAGAFNATVHLLNAVETPPVMDPMQGALLWVNARERVLEEAEASMARLRATLCVPSRVETVLGIPSEAILTYAQEHAIDLIVMATHGRRGLARMLIGSTTERVLRQAPCPVVGIRPGTARHTPAREGAAKVESA